MLDDRGPHRPDLASQADHFAPDRYLLKKEVARLLRYTIQHVDRLARTDPMFPRKVRIGKNRVGFLRSEVRAYLAAREAAAKL